MRNSFISQKILRMIFFLTLKRAVPPPRWPLRGRYFDEYYLTNIQSWGDRLFILWVTYITEFPVFCCISTWLHRWNCLRLHQHTNEYNIDVFNNLYCWPSQKTFSACRAKKKSLHCWRLFVEIKGVEPYFLLCCIIDHYQFLWAQGILLGIVNYSMSEGCDF